MTARRPKLYPCPNCGDRHLADDLDDFTGECLTCRGPRPATAARKCEWCGVAISGHAHRRTCSTKHRVALHRAGGVGPYTPTTEAL
jgi:hypothetical protein